MLKRSSRRKPTSVSARRRRTGGGGGGGVEALVAQEADERQAEAARRVDREAGGRADGAEHRDAGHRGLLHELEGGAARDQRDGAAERRRAGEQRLPMTLSSALWRPTSSRTSVSSPSAREQARGVQAARCARTCAARCAGARAGSPMTLAATTGPSGERLRGDLDRVDRGLAADAAGRRHAEVALHELGLERPAQVHGDDVVGLLAELDVGAVLDLGRARAASAAGPRSAGSPAASSKSLPGVRIVTATRTASWPGPAARISSGSSPARRSLRSRPAPSSTASTRVSTDAPRRGGRSVAAMRLLLPPPRPLHVLVAEAPLDAEVAARHVVVVGARDLHDRIVLHVQLEIAADAAVRADRRA